MIYKFQPFSPQKNLGLEYNSHCALVPATSDWILILDYDAMILDPRSYSFMERAIAENPDTEIFGAMTNRVGYAHQRLMQKGLDKTDSVVQHLAIAKEQADAFGSKTVDAPTVAGFFLLFQKQYWMGNNFQEKIWSKNGRLFDWVFCDAAARRRTIKIIKGIYVWHTYRILQADYRETKHLK